MEELLNKLFNDSILENINKEPYTNIFKLPIEYIDEKISLNENIIKDLELLNNTNNEQYSLYHNIFDKKTLFGSINLELWSKYYTNNKDFLIDSQNLYRSYNSIIINDDNFISDDNIFNLSTEIIEDDNFIERFHYIELPYLKSLTKMKIYCN